MKTPAARIRPVRPCSASRICGITRESTFRPAPARAHELRRQSTFCPPANQPSKTYKDCTASADPISDRIVPRFFALYRETEFFCKSKTASFNSTQLDRAILSLPCIASAASLQFPAQVLPFTIFTSQNLLPPLLSLHQSTKSTQVPEITP